MRRHGIQQIPYSLYSKRPMSPALANGPPPTRILKQFWRSPASLLTMCVIPSFSSRLELTSDKTVLDKRKGTESSSVRNPERRPVNQETSEQKPTVMVADKGKRVDRGSYNYGASPSSLGAGPSSTTWASRPSKDISRVVSLS
jgi:hypothetical protein